MTSVEKYGLFEYRFTLKVEKPFSLKVRARFTSNSGKEIIVNGFYDGDDTFAIRFMPEEEGVYIFGILSNIKVRKGSFKCTPSSHNGRIVANGAHLESIDGTPHFSVGTTCYALFYQDEKIREETLVELGKGYFNKIRICVFPKFYKYNEEEPDIYPFCGKPGLAQIIWLTLSAVLSTTGESHIYFGY